MMSESTTPLLTRCTEASGSSQIISAIPLSHRSLHVGQDKTIQRRPASPRIGNKFKEFFRVGWNAQETPDVFCGRPIIEPTRHDTRPFCEGC